MVAIILVDLLVSIIVSTVLFACTYSLKRSSRLWIAIFFLTSIALITLLTLINIHGFPYSPVLVFASATFAGTLLGKALSRRTKALFSLLLVASALDILSFVTGAQSTGVPSSTGQSSAIIDYVNLTLPLGSNLHFRIGILDLLLVSAVIMFFATNGLHEFSLLALSILSLMLPFVYLLLVPSGDGIPLIPFIASTALVFQVIWIGSKGRKSNKFQNSG